MRLIFEDNIDGEDFLEFIVKKSEVLELTNVGLCRLFPSAFSARTANVLIRIEEPVEELFMPLVKGKAAKTKKGFSENIEREMAAGKPQKQAVAIAYSEAERSKKKPKAKKK